ncbi:MAG: two pore domain potassium channel family protein [Spirulinaceae cyanobacterium RM2_2_10]|nr:two pore domain potassium channel family protein [Spirulinaceae cyanobacterium SM2_1_0]NJO19355.1 two pore domain potassium channel family protein [Spirulinaceae cyanobacterium RM2_2_10]
MRFARRPGTKKYWQLLIILVMNFLVAPFLEAGLGQVFSSFLLLYAIILIVRSFPLSRIFLAVYVMIAVLAFSLEAMVELGAIPSLNQVFSITAQIIFALYLGGAAYLISQDIFRAPKITGDMVRGGVSVYLLLGFVWALFYGIIATLDPQAFSQPLLSGGSYLDAFHFSFTTLTTLGYGDIYPVSEAARVLANLEAIAGQMYSTIFIAILVGGYLSERTNDAV